MLSEPTHVHFGGGVLDANLFARARDADAGVNDLRDERISLLVGWLVVATCARPKALPLIYIICFSPLFLVSIGPNAS